MKRYAFIAGMCLTAVLAGSSSALAQVAPPPSDSKFYADFNFGPTLGHKSSGFYGVEAGLKLNADLDVIIDISHMNNVGTTDLDNNAQVIANYLGGTQSSAFVTTHGAVGIRYHMEATPMIHPYALAAVGIASVRTEVVFTVNSAVVDPATKNVQLGGDLSGTANKTILVFGFGVNVPFMERYFADLGYRYGQILANTSNVENDKSIPTQRIMLGVGVRF